MPIDSYAQNFEDVILWRMLHSIANGCYIDIGAQHPIIDSVSKAFYEKNWRGIHVEPTAQYANLLRQDRPDEMVIQAAVSDARALIPLYEFADTGLSTLDEQIAQRHIQAGFKVNQTSAPTITLDDVFTACPQQEIHWLKIDVEGHERQVLNGWKESPQRPWIIIVESTLPLTQQESFASWDGLLVQKGYQFVYFDGLNRFYVSQAKPELINESWIPPNVFDGFLIHGTASNVISQSFTQRLAAAEESNRAVLTQEIEHHQQEQVLQQEREQVLLSEIASLKQNINNEQLTAKAAEAKFKQQVDNARDELGQMVRLISSREQEFAAQRELLLQEQQQRHEQGIAREQTASASLAQAQQQLQELEASWLQRENVFNEQAANAQVQLQVLSDSVRQKEQVFATQLLQTQKEKAGQANAFHMREQSLRKEIAVVSQKLMTSQQEREFAEQELQSQLLGLREQIESLLAKQIAASLEYQHRLELQQQEASFAQRLLRTEVSDAKQAAISTAQSYESQLEAVRQDAISAAQVYESRLEGVKQESISIVQAYESKLESVKQEAISTIGFYDSKLENVKNEVVSVTRRYKDELENVRLEASTTQKTLQSNWLAAQQDAKKAEAIHRQREEFLLQQAIVREQHFSAELKEYQKQNISLQEVNHNQQLFLQSQVEQKERYIAELLEASEVALLKQQATEQSVADLHRLGEKREQEFNAALAVAETQAQGYIVCLQQKEQHIGELLEQREKILQDHLQKEAEFSQHQHLKEAELAELLRLHTENVAALNEEIAATQKINHQLRSSLDILYGELAFMKASLSWRLAKPFRVLREWIQPSSAMPTLNSFIQENIGWSPQLSPSVSVQYSTAIESFFMQITSELAGQIQPASHINELLHFHGNYFIRCVFLTFLVREPTNEEMAHWQYALSTGRSKPRIIAEIVNSAEWRAKSINLPGLKRLLKRDKIAQFPIIGWYLARKFHIEGNAPADKHMRVVETQLFQLSKQIVVRFDEQDKKIKELQSAGEQQHLRLCELLESKDLVLVEKHESGDIAQSESLKSELNRMSANTRVIYKQLSNAIAARA